MATITGRTDGQTDRQTDRQSATQYAAPSYGGGPHNNNRPSLTYFQATCTENMYIYRSPPGGLETTQLTQYVLRTFAVCYIVVRTMLGNTQRSANVRI